MSNPANAIEKVLVVVDVQTGFVKGGSFFSHNKGESKSLPDIYKSIEQTCQIAELISKNKSIVFTRDFHPINHLSIGVPQKVATNYYVTWPSHCTNNGSQPCIRTANEQNAALNNPTNKNYGLSANNMKHIHEEKSITVQEFINLPTIQNILNGNNNTLNSAQKNIKILTQKLLTITDSVYLYQPLIGTNISFLMLMTQYAPEVLSLIVANKPIGIPVRTPKSGDPDYKNLVDMNAFTLTTEGKTFVQLVKGQLCKYESYSAFNYHQKLTLSKKTVNKELAKYNSTYITDKTGVLELNKLSTGLFEYILGSKSNNIEITVCGLVGDVCVINTVTEGIILWKQYYSTVFPAKKVVFNYSLSGTLFSGVPVLGFSSDQPKFDTEPNKIKFFEDLCAYLDKNIPEFKELITFNVLDYNGNHSGMIMYNPVSNNNVKEKFVYEMGSNKKVIFGGKKSTKKLVKKLVKKVKSTKK